MDSDLRVPTVRSRQRWFALAPVLLGGLLVFGLLGHLLRPGTVMADRDVPFFHLPLRLDFARLLGDGLPVWNPWLHGGQPVLSNPSYAAWYPTTWLVAGLPAHRALAVAVVLHGLLAFAGAYRFARHLGCVRAGAALAATAFAAGGWFLALTNTVTVFLGMAWFPWVLLLGDRALRAPNRAAVVRALVVGGCAWGLQMLNGEPAAVVVTGLALALLGLGDRVPGVSRLATGRRLAALALLALLVGAVQLVPTWFRLRDSVRGEGLGLAQTAVWSARPERLVELVAPHVYGDVARDEEDLYFGWALHDRGTPFLLSIAPGLLALVLAAAALSTRAVPRRTLWLGAVGVGLFLGLGRHNPLFPYLHAAVPFLSTLRYPEKFLLLPLACLPFAAALGWQQLLERRRAGRHWRPPLLAAAIAGVLAVALAAACWWPGAAEALVRAQSGLPPPPEVVGKGADYLRREALVAAANALLVGTFLLWARRRERSELALAVAAVALLAADLGYYGRCFSPTLPETVLFAPPAVARALPAGERVFTDLAFRSGPEAGPRLGEPGTYEVRGRLEWLDPYSGNLWSLGHVLHEDLDLMLTSWARVPLAALHAAWPDRELVSRIAGAWNAGTLVHVRSPAEMLPELRAGQTPALASASENPAVLPRFRSVPEAWFHADPRAALAAARGARYRVGEREHLVGPGPSGAERARFQPAAILASREGGRGIALRVRAAGPALVVCAVTYDRGWSAEAGGEPLPLWPTALGQIAALVPAGEHQVRLRYRDPWVAVGGALSMVTLLAMVLTWRRTGRDSEP